MIPRTMPQTPARPPRSAVPPPRAAAQAAARHRAAAGGPAVPAALPMAEALARSGPLQSLLGRLRAAEARVAVVRALLPPALAERVQPGPLEDDGSWSLIAPNPAAAAKLRQWLPTLAAALKARGLGDGAVAVRVGGRALPGGGLSRRGP